MIQEECFLGENDSRIKHSSVFKGNDSFRVRSKIVLREDTNNYRYAIILPAKH